LKGGAYVVVVDEKELMHIRNVIETSNLFDKVYYRNLYYDRVKNEFDLILHYIKEGAALGFDPSPLFDTKYYMKQISGLHESGLNPLYHYIIYGISEFRSPLSMNKDDKIAMSDPYERWCENQCKKGVSRLVLFYDAKLILKSGEFDAEYYEQLTGVPKDDVRHQIRHYLRNGIYEGINPNRVFDIRYYVNKYGTEFQMRNPFIHYIKYGRKNGMYGIEPNEAAVSSDYLHLRYAYNQLRKSYKSMEQYFLKAPISGVLLDYTVNSVKKRFVFHLDVVINIIFQENRSEDAKSLRVIIEREKYPFKVNVLLEKHITSLIPSWQFVWEINDLDTDIVTKVLNYGVYCADDEVLALLIDYDESDYSQVITANSFLEANDCSAIIRERCIIKQAIRDNKREFDSFETMFRHGIEGGKIIKIGSSKVSFNKGQGAVQVKSNKKCILISQYSFSYGGGEIMPIRLANQFKRIGYSVLVHILAEDKEDAKVRAMLSPDIPVVRTDNEEEMILILRTHHIDIVNTHHQASQSFFARVLRMDLDLKKQIYHVGTSHGMYNAFTDKDFIFIIKELLGYVDYWTYVADKNIEPFLKYGCYNADVFRKIPNGIEKPIIHPISRTEMGIKENAFVFCLASRAIKEKGWQESIKAITIARERIEKDIHLILIGDGPVYEELTKINIPDFVHLMGFKDNPCDYYAISNAMLLASNYSSESAPLSLIEALQCGIPVIASDIGDIRQMLELPEGMAGVVFELQDGEIPIEKVASAIEELVKEEQFYEICKRYAEIKAKAFDIKAVAMQYLEVFNRV